MATMCVSCYFSYVKMVHWWEFCSSDGKHCIYRVFECSIDETKRKNIVNKTKCFIGGTKKYFGDEPCSFINKLVNGAEARVKSMKIYLVFFQNRYHIVGVRKN